MFDQSPSQQRVLPVRSFPTRTFTTVDSQTQIDQLRQMIASLQTRIAALENA